MICSACQMEVTPESVYCHRCGARLDEPRPGDKRFDSPQPADSDPVPDPPQVDSAYRAATSLGLGTGSLRAARDEPERELWQGGFSPRAMIGAWIGTSVATVLLLIIGTLFFEGWSWWAGLLAAIVFMWAFQVGKLGFRRLNIHYRLTNHRFFHERGILRRVSDRIEVIDMDDITFEQGVIERFVGVGTIRIASSDVTDPEIWLRGIDDVKRVAGLIDDARRAERMRRGLHIESI